MVNLNVYEKTQKKRKKEHDNDKSIKYKIKLIDSFRFMSSKLSYLVNNLYEIYSKSVEGVKKERKSQHAISLDLKIINCIINATNVKEDQ